MTRRRGPATWIWSVPVDGLVSSPAPVRSTWNLTIRWGLIVAPPAAPLPAATLPTAGRSARRAGKTGFPNRPRAGGYGRKLHSGRDGNYIRVGTEVASQSGRYRRPDSSESVSSRGRVVGRVKGHRRQRATAIGQDGSARHARTAGRFLARPVATHSGRLLETFVAGELARQLSWADTGARLHHFRDRSGIEVDLVLERPDGRVAGIEVKAAASVADDDLRGLRLLRDRLGSEFATGVVLHCGERTDSFGDRLLALPITALWAH